MMKEQKPRSAEQATCSAKAELAEADVRKALECCVKRECMPCPNKERRTGITECMEFLMQDALTLLCEKDAENDRLTIIMNAYGLTAKNLAKEFEDYRADVQMEIADARAEAITEFAERLKSALLAGGIYPVIVKNAIDQIAKEMKGEGATHGE